MHNTNNLKSLVSIVLSMIIIFTSVILNATTLDPISPSEHKKIINQFISEITDAQSQSLNIAQSSLKNSINTNQLQQQITTISNNLQLLNNLMENYADIVEGLSDQDRHIRLTFNYLNLIRSNLYTLTLLIRATTDIEKIQLLDEYFRTRINAVNTLTILESILEKYNAQLL